MKIKIQMKYFDNDFLFITKLKTRIPVFLFILLMDIIVLSLFHKHFFIKVPSKVFIREPHNLGIGNVYAYCC